MSGLTDVVDRPSIGGFGHIKRFRDPRLGRVSAKILPGEFYVTTSPDEVITTVLGSCVAACIWDPEVRIGGMNHFMIPDPGEGAETGDRAAAGRYGVFAMDLLVDTILTNGGRRTHLRVKLAGGGHVISSPTAVGSSNVRFAHRYLDDEGLPLVAEHVEGLNARRLVFEPLTGRTRVLELSTGDHGAVVRGEREYAATLATAAPVGSVELF